MDHTQVKELEEYYNNLFTTLFPNDSVKMVFDPMTEGLFFDFKPFSRMDLEVAQKHMQGHVTLKQRMLGVQKYRYDLDKERQRLKNQQEEFEVVKANHQRTYRWFWWTYGILAAINFGLLLVIIIRNYL